MCVKQVIVVRKDLKMRKGKIASQVAHASMKSIFGNIDNDTITSNNKLTICLDNDLRDWLTNSFIKVVVGCDSEDELLALDIKAEQQMLRHAIIKDNGTTVFHGIPTYTTLAIGPAEESKIDSITGHLKLL